MVCSFMCLFVGFLVGVSVGVFVGWWFVGLFDGSSFLLLDGVSVRLLVSSLSCALACCLLGLFFLFVVFFVELLRYPLVWDQGLFLG